MRLPMVQAVRVRAKEAAPGGMSAEVGEQTAVWFQQARIVVGDLYRRAPVIYWTDFLLSISAAWALAFVYFMAPVASLTGALAGGFAAALFFRAGVFMHEIVHMPPQEMAAFRWAWNLLHGIPLLMPWVLYRNHADHHSAQRFGSPNDGEYLPLAASPLRETLKYLAQVPLLPLFMVVRFAVLAPLSWCHGGLREWVLTRASAAASNPYYRKRFPQRDEPHLLQVEVLCFAYLLAIAALVRAGVIDGVVIGKAYGLLATALGLNWLRNLAAHRYDNRGAAISHLEQFRNSINITGGGVLTLLLFPVGMRYHALHHLFPSIPYHNLGKAHRRLLATLPPEAPYRSVGAVSIFQALAVLLRAAARTPPADSAMPRWTRSADR